MRTGLIDFLSIDIYNVASTSDINIEVQRWKSDVSFCFIFNVRSALSKVESKGSTTLKQSWFVFEMLIGIFGIDIFREVSLSGFIQKA